MGLTDGNNDTKVLRFIQFGARGAFAIHRKKAKEVNSLRTTFDAIGGGNMWPRDYPTSSETERISETRIAPTVKASS